MPQVQGSSLLLELIGGGWRTVAFSAIRMRSEPGRMITGIRESVSHLGGHGYQFRNIEAPVRLETLSEEG